MMGVTYEKKQHEKAKAERLWLITVDIDGRPAKKFGPITFQGPATEEEADILQEALKRIYQFRNSKKPDTAPAGRGG